MVPVEISGRASANLEATFENSNVVAQLRGRYAAGATCQIIEISFPAGAAHIVYDPTMGAGQSPFSPSGPSDGKLSTTTIVIIACSVFAVLVVCGIIIFVVKRQAGYSTIA